MKFEEYDPNDYWKRYMATVKLEGLMILPWENEWWERYALNERNKYRIMLYEKYMKAKY